jgi:hypothetical protein
MGQTDYIVMRISKFHVLMAVMALTTAGANANLVYNGSFENVAGTFVDNTGQDTMDLLPGSGAIPGWVTTVSELAWIGPSNPFQLTASDGQYFLDLSGYHDNVPYAGVASVNIATTPGQTYHLSFDIGSSLIYDQRGLPAVQVSANANNLGTFTVSSIPGINNWETFGVSFTANSESTALSFTGASPVYGLEYIGLDNVNVAVTAIPEPATMLAGAMLLLPFGVSTLRILRQRQQA